MTAFLFFSTIAFAEPKKSGDGVLQLSSLIPAEKNLPPDWVASLYARGEPECITEKAALMRVGMPVGGLFCGTVYLGGDGKLWLWDIFNDNREGIIPKLVEWESLPGNPVQKVRPRDGAFYVEPEDAQSSPFVRGFPQANAVKLAKHGEELKAGEKPINKNKEILAQAEQFRQGFALVAHDGKNTVRPLDHRGWKNVKFTGAYPVGTVEFSDPDSPVTVTLDAYSPFIPLNTADSSLPVTILRYTVTNISDEKNGVSVSIGGWMENAVCINSAAANPDGARKNKIVNFPTGDGRVIPAVIASAFARVAQVAAGREDIVFENFEKENYAGWISGGTAFGDAPLDNSRVPPYMGDVGMEGSRAAVSHNVRSGGNVADGDTHKGFLRSDEFSVTRDYIQFRIAGGNRKNETGLRLIVDGKTVRAATGHNSNKLRFAHFDTREFLGKKARLEIFDNATGGWGNIIVDDIIFSDKPSASARPLREQPDFGTMAIALIDTKMTDYSTASAPFVTSDLPEKNSAESLLILKRKSADDVEKDFSQTRPIGGVARTVMLAEKNDTVTFTFAVTWHFPNIYLGAKGDAGTPDGGRHYKNQFTDAGDVVAYAGKNYKRLENETFLWRDTWYDSTLPHWFLDRTFANTSTLATTTSHRFADGRFYAWEGVGACPGTCTHVWQYAQAPARLFPEIERITRERVDLGIGFTEKTGRIGMRAEHAMVPAIDGQCGRIMGLWREHCMSADGEFLKRIWPRAKKAVEHVLAHDADGDGILDGAQENTLDAAWFGEIAWTSIQSLGALAAGEKMAEVMGDAEFAKKCRERRVIGKSNIKEKLFNGEYFFQKQSPEKPNNFGTYNASFIDQLFGQSMAYQCGLGEIIDSDKARAALNAIWKYNFAFDLTDYLKHVRPLGRPYYAAGEGGTLMATNARNEKNPYRGGSWTHGYLNECMTGFEHQYASHLMRVGEVEKAFAVTRVIHDRYNAAKRNPYNEIECSDHYSRAMASYGTFLSACGYDYNGPAGHLTFSPKVAANGRFKAAFTAAEGWGTFSQEKTAGKFAASISLRYGRLRLNEISFAAGDGKSVAISLNKIALPAVIKTTGETVTVRLHSTVEIKTGDTLEISIAP